MEQWTVTLLMLGAASGPSSATPTPVVEPWRPKGISSAQFESHPAFDPLTGDFYFVRGAPDFTGWRILVSHCGKHGWSAPEAPPFAGDGVEADPFFTNEGRTLYFISTRSTDGVHRSDLDIWRADRATDGTWGMPVRLPEPVNSPAQEWFPRPGPGGWLYFGSSRPGGFGRTDIWRARQDESGKWLVENAGAALNSPADEYEPLPAPDGQSMILMAIDGLYESRRLSDAPGGDPSGNARGDWAPRHKLDPPVNVNGSEIGALFSPSGRSLLFARDLKGTLSGEFFVWRIQGHENWPPACPRD
ncbi:MAG: hypothetical protein WDO68_19580 [Gammaproteobacteria bacterium]